MGDILDQETCNTTLGLGISLDDFVPKRDIQQKNHSKKPPVIYFDQLSFPFHFKDEQEIMEIGSSHKTEGSITSVSNNNGGSAGTGVSKKLRLTKEQSTLLEDSFKQHSAPNVVQKQALAEKLNLRPRQVEVWFQNRRARTKLKQTEVDCEFLKKCCENLSNENRRLKKEVQDLRSSSKSLFLQLQKANTANRYSVCSSCQKIIRFKGGNGGAGAGAGAVIGGDHNIVKVEPRTLMAAATAHAELGLYQAEPKKNPLINNVLR